jgi:hypothetical protein
MDVDYGNIDILYDNFLSRRYTDVERSIINGSIQSPSFAELQKLLDKT